MLLRCPPPAIFCSFLNYTRSFSSSLSFVSLSNDYSICDPSVPLEYLEGFPKPDPKYSEKILAIPRVISGKNISAKERKAGRVPGIVFEQKKVEDGWNERLISVKAKQLGRLVGHLGQSFFLSRLFDLEVRSAFEDESEVLEKVRVLPRLLHLDAVTDNPLNVTFMRTPTNALLKINVPLVFRGEDICPGLRKGAYLNTIKRTVKCLCPADIIPPYIDVDLSELDVGKKVVTKELKVHPALKLLISPDQPICSLIGSKSSSDHKKS